MGYTLAVDIGGTKIAAGILDENKLWVSEHMQKSDISTPEGMYQSMLTSIYEVLDQAEITKDEIDKIGVAIPGQADIEKGIAIYSNNLPWRNFHIGDLLKKEFPAGEVGFEHDVTAAALGELEARRKDSELFVYVTISTGIGACILYKGRPVRGNGMAGEIGFFPVGDQTLETYASGSGMEKELQIDYGGISLVEAFEKWKKQDIEYEHFFQRKASQISLALFQLTAALDPHKIVVGGGVVNNQPEFYSLVQQQYRSLCRHPLQQNWKSKLEPSILKSRAGMYGVACKVSNYETVQ